MPTYKARDLMWGSFTSVICVESRRSFTEWLWDVPPKPPLIAVFKDGDWRKSETHVKVSPEILAAIEDHVATLINADGGRGVSFSLPEAINLSKLLK